MSYVAMFFGGIIAALPFIFFGLVAARLGVHCAAVLDCRVKKSAYRHGIYLLRRILRPDIPLVCVPVPDGFCGIRQFQSAVVIAVCWLL